MSVYKNRREELENQLNKGAIWAVTYGDLMSYLMIFFLVLFSFSIAKTDKSKTRTYEESLSNIQAAFGGKKNIKMMEKAQRKKDEQAVEDKLQESLKNQNTVQFESSEQKFKLTFTEAVLFDSGKSELKEKAKNILAEVATGINNLPNTIIVEGHTDNVPIRHGRYQSNWELSMARAYSVIQYLEKQGVNPRRLAGIGYGEQRPIGDNKTPEGKAKNRRIELTLIKTEFDYGAQAVPASDGNGQVSVGVSSQGTAAAQTVQPERPVKLRAEEDSKSAPTAEKSAKEEPSVSPGTSKGLPGF